MKHKGFIRDTLKRTLFQNPHPIDNAIFAKEKDLIFPCEEVFLEFLSTEDHQLRINLARKIILRLIFHHSLPPPSILLNNLLNLQNDDAQAIKDGDYIPQDHYVHIVNLYLLGVYIFSYHRDLHDKCTQELNRLKRFHSKQGTGIAFEYSKYRLFSLFWTYFVLYHDIAYPLERIKPTDRSNPLKSYLLDDFKVIFSLILKDLALKSLSKIIAIKSVLSSSQSKKFYELYPGGDVDVTVYDQGKEVSSIKFTAKGCKGEKKYSDILNKWQSSTCITAIEGPRSLKMLLSFFPPR